MGFVCLSFGNTNIKLGSEGKVIHDRLKFTAKDPKRRREGEWKNPSPHISFFDLHFMLLTSTCPFVSVF